jgi:hypothetical protein
VKLADNQNTIGCASNYQADGAGFMSTSACILTFPVEISSADGKDVSVRRANALMALILAVLWLPVTMHCSLEALPGLEFLICCAHDDTAAPHEDDDCEADACAVVESGFYKLQDHEDLVAVSGDFEVINSFHSNDTESGVGQGVPAEPHPECVGWQFSSRAAPLPRAPSFLL